LDKKVLVPIAQGTEEMEAIIVIDMLRRAGMTVCVAGENEIITCSRNTKMIPDKLIEQINADDEFAAIVLPGGALGTENLLNNYRLEEILRFNYNNGSILAAVCAAPTILMRHKLLPLGCKVTSHPSVASQFEHFAYLDSPVVISGKIITSRGAGTTIEFALAIIAELLDKEVADRIANDIVLFN
jgi:DJ-1 family protein